MPEELESGAAEHLAFEHLDPVDVPFNDAGAVEQGQPGGHGVPVAVDAVGEDVQARQGIDVDPAQPVAEPVAAQVDEHVGEAADMPGGGLQLRAAGQHGLEPGPVVHAQGLGIGHNPAGHLPHCRRHRRRCGDDSGGVEHAQVGRYRAVAAPVTPCGDLPVQLGGAGRALPQPLVQVGLVGIKDRLLRQP